MPKSETSQFTKYSEKLSAAKALPKKPDKVMAIWIVDKKSEGSLFSFNNLSALLSPSSIFLFKSAVFKEMTAISLAAKNAFTNIKITCNSICKGIESK